jgi:hypothetical protein
MFSISVNNFILTMASVLLLAGIVMLVIGVIIIMTRVLNKDMRVLADQTTKLAQKGITDGIAGLVGNASSLLDAMDRLMKTTAGVAVFVILIALVLFGASYALVSRIPVY